MRTAVSNESVVCANGERHAARAKGGAQLNCFGERIFWGGIAWGRQF
jgi:hypothetical protein